MLRRAAFIALALTLAANAGATIAAIYANKITRKHFIAARRPWVSISDLEFTENLRFAPGGALVSVKFVAKNFGPTPAINADSYVEMISVQGINIPNELQRFAGRLKKRKVVVRTVFPEDPWEIGEAVSMTRDAIDKGTFDLKGIPSIGIVFLYGVRYQVVAGGDPYVTANAWVVPFVRVDDPNPIGIAMGILAGGGMILGSYAD